MIDKHVKRKIDIRFAPGSIPARIKVLRKRMGADQNVMAEYLGVTQATISGWENGVPLSPMALMALGRMDDENMTWWYEQAGPRFAERLKLQHLIRNVRAERKSKIDERLLWIPLLHDPLGAGLLRSVSDGDVDREIPFSAELVPSGGKLRAIRVSGDSMAPIVNDGYIVVIDAAQCDPRKLVGRMVAAREAEGVTIKWLRKDKEFYLLVPQHISPHIPVRVMRPEDDWGIVGVALKWIGYPPAGK